MTGETTILGKVIRVGGKDPKVAIETTDNRTITCRTTQSIAKELGKKLYSIVSLNGLAHWNLSDLSIEEFVIKSIGSYEDGSMVDTMEAISREYGQFFKDVDPEGFVKETRKDD